MPPRKPPSGRARAAHATEAGPKPALLILLKGYPRISETFIAQELLAFQQAGLSFEIVSLRPPYDPIRHPIHDQITAPVRYLPETLREAPGRVLRALVQVVWRTGFWAALARVFSDLVQDQGGRRDRLRRFGQAMVVAAEAPRRPLWLHAHFAHTPSSVARYAALIRGARFSISAHAKDIWASPDWDLRQKLTEAAWTVTCTRVGQERLAALAPDAPVHLVYHGLDLSRFPPFDGARSGRDGRTPSAPVQLLSVGRAVAKKGYDTLLTALAALPPDLSWRLEHIGRGPDLPALEAQAAALGLQDRISWRGVQDQQAVLAAYRRADLFVLASQPGPDGDRDGLPNVLVEAASQALPAVSTAFSAIPELIADGQTGLLVAPNDASALAAALARAITDPALRQDLGQAAEARVRTAFDLRPGIEALLRLLPDS